MPIEWLQAKSKSVTFYQRVLIDTYSPLRRLRNFSTQRLSTHLRFEHVNLRSGSPHISSIRMLRTWMVLSITSTPRKSLSREIRQSPPIQVVTVDCCSVRKTIDRLIGCCTDITGVIGIRPLHTKIKIDA